MSTIASPRDPSATPLGARRINSSSQAAPPPPTTTTPTSSSRPSLDLPRSTSGSPNPNAAVSSSKRANRAALREYYNLKKQQTAGAGTPTLEVTDPLGDINDALSAAIVAQQQQQNPHNNAHSDIPPSELDSPSFDADAYVGRVLKEQGLAELLRTYTRILGEMRALDAEKKALVYDNYSKLISATETIRKMRATMDPLNPMASTLDLVIAKIYEQASGIREEVRAKVPPPQLPENAGEGERRREQTRVLAQKVLGVPEQLRRLVGEGKEEEARKQWEMPRRLLERWKERRLGGDEVSRLIEEGDGIVRSSQSDTTTAGAAS